MARRLSIKSRGHDPETQAKLDRLQNTDKGGPFFMMSPTLQRLANTWLLPLTLVIMSPVIIYEKWNERQAMLRAEAFHEN